MTSRIALGILAVITAIRLVLAFALPLTGDEAYYWEWSRHLAAGYVDHPPAVAWVTRAGRLLGTTPGTVRIGFVICGVLAAWAIWRCAALLGGNERAGAYAALALSLAPLSLQAFGMVTPDGPYLACWCFGLWFAARFVRDGRARDAVLLGIALGGALLSRHFALALVIGVIGYVLQSAPASRRRGLGVALVTAAVIYSPYLWWNALHEWVGFAFALVYRHHGDQAVHPATSFLSLLGIEAAAYSPGLWLAALAVAVRPRVSLVTWTALPFGAALTLFACVRNVQVYWLLGVYASLCVGIGVGACSWSPRIRVLLPWFTAIPVALLLIIASVVALEPGSTATFLAQRLHVRFRNAGPFEMYSFLPLSRDAAEIARRRDALVISDGYGLSSLLDFDAGLPPIVVGYDWQGRESRGWYPSSEQPKRLLFVDRFPLSTRPDFQKRLALACGIVSDGGAHAYHINNIPARSFYFTWCEQPHANVLDTLRWDGSG
jgi:hypothetical protein